MTAIPHYIHRCDVLPQWADSPARVSVDAWDYEYGRRCDVCGKPLVTTEQLLAHIYGELTQ